MCNQLLRPPDPGQGAAHRVTVGTGREAAANPSRKMACDGTPRHRRTIEVRQRELEEVLMGIVGGFDVHRQQITFDYLDTETAVQAESCVALSSTALSTR